MVRYAFHLASLLDLPVLRSFQRLTLQSRSISRHYLAFQEWKRRWISLRNLLDNRSEGYQSKVGIVSNRSSFLWHLLLRSIQGPIHHLLLLHPFRFQNPICRLTFCRERLHHLWGFCLVLAYQFKLIVVRFCLKAWVCVSSYKSTALWFDCAPRLKGGHYRLFASLVCLDLDSSDAEMKCV